jgi:hypothetical protein
LKNQISFVKTEELIFAGCDMAVRRGFAGMETVFHELRVDLVPARAISATGE